MENSHHFFLVGDTVDNSIVLLFLLGGAVTCNYPSNPVVTVPL